MSSAEIEKPHTARVLVVDDQAGMRLTLKGILLRKGHEVTVAESGEEAIDQFKRRDFDVVFMDIKMPGMSGVEALAGIRRLKPKVPVVMMTAYAVEDDMRRAIREGAYTVLHKPFDVERVLQIIQESLAGRTLVLVVDDREEDRKVLHGILAQRNCDVAEAASGEDCIKMIRERRFHVVILDIRLPGIDGVQTLRQIKELRPDAAVILMSGYRAEPFFEEAARYGSALFLKKPYDPAHLLEAIDKCLAGSGR